MKFLINNDIWHVLEKDNKNISEKYNSETDEKSYFTFGLTIYSKHEIWINKEMCYEQKIKTLKHELTHCYIWEYGLYNAPNFNEEMVCDLVSSINDFINDIVNRFEEEMKDEEQ